VATYVVFLLDYGGFSPRGVAEERVLLTAGGALAPAVHVPVGGPGWWAAHGRKP